MSTHNSEDCKAASSDNGPSRIPGTPVADLLGRVPRARDTGVSSNSVRVEHASSSSGPDCTRRGGSDNAGAMQMEASTDLADKDAGTVQGVPARRRARAVAKPSMAPHLVRHMSPVPVGDTLTASHDMIANEEDDCGFGCDAFCLEPPEPLAFGTDAVLVMTEQGELKPRRVSTACAKLLVRSGLRCPFCFRHRAACIC